jgi:hypothetical protein
VSSSKPAISAERGVSPPQGPGKSSGVGTTHGTLFQAILLSGARNILTGQAWILCPLLDLGARGTHVNHWQETEEGMPVFLKEKLRCNF